MLEGCAYRFPAFSLAVCADGERLRRVSFGELPPDVPRRETAVILRARGQIEEYLAGTRRRFDLPLWYGDATPFRRTVWRALLDIPYGRTRSYKDIARRAGNENAARAVGGAVHVNPLAIIIPCHRVIGADGDLTGFAGGLAIKRLLLDLEAG